MTKSSRVHYSSVLFSFLLSLPLTALADTSRFPMVLESKDPEKPLEVIDDKDWIGSEMTKGRDSWGELVLAPFTNDSSKGPVTLVVDYAATRPDQKDGEALIEISVECPESGTPCSIPITQSVMGIRTAFMGESAIKIDGAPQAIWVARQSHTYSFPPDTLVSVSLSPDKAPSHLEPVAIRARLIYGDYSREALPGQETRVGIFGKISIAVLLLLAGFFWWVKRQ